MINYLEQGNFLYAMAALCVIGMISRFAANHFYKGLIRQCDNLAAARDKQLQQMKLKYESVYRSSCGMKNTGAFVSKMLQQYRIGGLRLATWESGAFYTGITVFLLGALSALILYMNQGPASVSILYLAAGSLMAAAMLMFSGIMDAGCYRDSFETALLHYFENVLVVRSVRELPDPLEDELEENETEDSGEPARSGLKSTAAARAKRSMRDDIFMKKEKRSSDREWEDKSRLRRQEPEAKPEEDRGQKQLEELKESLAQIAAARGENTDRSGHRQTTRKLTPKEEQLINEIIEQYLS